MILLSLEYDVLKTSKRAGWGTLPPLSEFSGSAPEDTKVRLGMSKDTKVGLGMKKDTKVRLWMNNGRL